MNSSFKAAILAVAAFGFVACNTPKTTTTENAAAETSTVEQTNGIVYFNLDRVISEYDMANELKTAVEAKIAGIEKEINRRGNKLQNEFNDFNEKLNKGLITRSVAEVKGQKLQEEQNKFNQYANAKQQEIAEEQQVMLNQIGDAIKKFVDKFNAEKKYALIISTQGDILPAPVVTGDASLDVTDEIIAGINDEYLKTKDKSSQK